MRIDGGSGAGLVEPPRLEWAMRGLIGPQSWAWLDRQARIELHACPASLIQLCLRDSRAAQVGVV